MAGRVDKFLKILKIEVQDLVSDVEHYIAGQRERFEQERISEHVMKENVGLAQAEILAVQRFEAWVDGLSPRQFDSVEAACTHIREHVYEHVRGSARCPFVMHLLDRKLQKVRQYAEQGG